MYENMFHVWVFQQLCVENLYQNVHGLNFTMDNSNLKNSQNYVLSFLFLSGLSLACLPPNNIEMYSNLFAYCS